ncbi:hypothetical protein [Dethiobacter alkaliphilus]|uniref:CopG domain protein DNA-binding domain protein n=1 Tax=Dethiobacter alkaliphilus AHT 1 TaxID=555088 RepID=C0GGH6_DETAL|nr:hypothetical protein [Dethiobacter alkaliphilus]EEG77417.1 hypothetical protein DealDRAFT_1540 [Dethiobacter alkaliphilus AHT 1]
MILNVTVPKEKVHILDMLKKAAEETSKTEGELILEALENYLLQFKPDELGKFKLGKNEYDREDLYRYKLDNDFL